MHLPLELVHHILNFLKGDKEILSACSLVSSSWAESARSHLFHTLVYVKDKWDVPSFPSLLEFLQSAPSVCKHIRVLALEGGCEQASAFWGKLDSKTFAGLIGAIPHLQEVRIDVSFLLASSEDNDPKPSHPEVPPKPLQHLYINRLYVVDEHPCFVLRQFLHPISSIRVLRLGSITSNCDDMSVTHVRGSLKSLDLPINLNVQELILDTYSHHINYLFLDSVRLMSPPCLRHLQYEMFDDHETDGMERFLAFQNFLHDTAFTLETLTVKLGGRHARYPDLSKHQSLRTLTFIHETVARFKDKLPYSFDASINALASTARVPFELHFQLGYFMFDTQEFLNLLAPLNWEKLEQMVLLHPCRSNKLTITCKRSQRYFTGIQEVEGLIKGRLPTLERTGLLNLVQVIA